MNPKKDEIINMIKALVVLVFGAVLISPYLDSDFSNTPSNKPRPEVARQSEQLNAPRPFVCAKNSFAQDENDTLAMEYTNTRTTNCMFVGCGGIF